MGLLEGKVAVITGAASGIGAESARLFAAEGARVVIGDLQGSDGRQVAEAIQQSGGEAICVRTDVSQSANVQALMAAAVERWGSLDILFNNAEIHLHQRLLHESPEAELTRSWR